MLQNQGMGTDKFVGQGPKTTLQSDCGGLRLLHSYGVLEVGVEPGGPASLLNWRVGLVFVLVESW